MKRQIKEILTHECQTYAIAKCVEYNSNCVHVIDQLYDKQIEAVDNQTNVADFIKWRDYLLTSFYNQINFSNILRNSDNERVIYPMVYKVLKGEVTEMVKQSTSPTIDDELKINKLKHTGGKYGEKRSVAYKLSQQMYQELYPDIINESTFISSSKILIHRCQSICHSLFPLTYPNLAQRLREKDNEFWAEMVDVVKNFAMFLFYKAGVAGSREDEMSDFSMDCIEVLRKQSERDELATKSSATHLLHSIQVTCRNKWKEYQRQCNRYNTHFTREEDREWAKMADDSNLNYETMTNNRYDALEELDLLNVDTRNNYEVSCAVVHLLLHPDSYFYKLLVGKKESDVDILIWHTLDKMSYDEIAIKIYGEATDKNKATIRQKSSRITNWLKTRLIELIDECRSRSEVNIAHVN